MLARWLTNLETVHEATTQEERSAVYRFRYTVYVEELGRTIGGVDHAHRMVRDDDDDQPFSHHLYTGRGEDLSGTVRVRIWGPGEIPAYEMQSLSLHVFPGIEKMRISELGRLMIRPTRRGKLVLPSLTRAVYELNASTGCDLAFCYCAPGLVPHYRKLGFRPYAAPLVPTTDGMHVPLVAILSDEAYMKREGSPVASLVKKYFGPGKRPPMDLRPLADLLVDDALPIELDADRVWEEVQEEFLAQASPTASFLDDLPERAVKKLTNKGFVIDVAAGTLVTKKGYGERELFVILDGTVEVQSGTGQRIAALTRGELFGEVAFFREDGKRMASVVAVSDCRLLVLRRSFLDDLQKNDPALAIQILFKLGRILSDRLATT